MRSIPIILGLALFGTWFLASGQRIQAATPLEPAYRSVSLEAGFPWREGFRLNLAADEAKCRAKYGSSWRARCAAALGRAGDTVRGIRLSPHAAGYWLWDDGMSMRFVPADGESIKPDTVYTVDLSGLYRPEYVLLDKSVLKLRTLPLSARLQDMNFWPDPSPVARHRLAASFEFNYPVGAENIELLAPSGASFGKPDLVWSPDRDRLNISWPLKKLPEKQSQALIILKNMGQIALEDGKLKYWPASKKEKGVVFRANLPGQNQLFRIRKVELNAELDSELNRVHILELETSLYASPEDMLKNLEIWELPEFNSPGATQAYNWQNAPAIPAGVLESSRRLAPLPVDRDNGARANFRFSLPVTGGRYVFVRVNEGFASASGQKMHAPWLQVAHAEASTPSISFLQPGNILPLGGSGLLEICARDLDTLRWEVQLVREPFLALLAQASPEPFKAPLGNMPLGMETFTESVKGELPLPGAEAGKARFASLDLSRALEKLSRAAGKNSASGLAQINLVGFANGREKARASRMVLATDLGLLLKRSVMGGLDCFAHSLAKEEPLGNVRVSILGANGKPVTSGLTDAAGHVAFGSLAGLRRESRPVAAVAELDGQLAWLPLDDRSRELNYSAFQTGGIHVPRDGLNVFAFSQRGIYRPGEILHFGCLVRRADFALPPAEMPLTAELLDPRGMKIWESQFKSGKFGLAELNWQSPLDALSGIYTLNVLTGRAGENLGSVSVRMEAFQPDTLQLKIELPKVKGWLRIQPGKAETIGFALRNLYGQAAAKHRISSRLQTCPAHFSFPGFGDFVFTDASPFKGQGQKRNLPDGITNAQGDSSLNLPGELLGASSSRLLVFAEGFELGGGRATVASASILVSPMESILGYRPVGALTNLGFIPRNQLASVEFIALDSNLRKLDLDRVSFSLAHRRYATSLISDGNGGYRYDATPVDQPVKSWSGEIPVSGLIQKLDTDQAGEFLLTASDANGNVLARIPYTVAGERLDPPGAPLAGGNMRLRLDKDSYAAGDTIKLSVAVPYDGLGLISLERDGVLAFDWFNAKAGETAREIKIPDSFEGRGYVVVSFVRSKDSPAIYMSPHTFAVAPFSARLGKRDMRLNLNARKTVRPGDELGVKISAREPGQALLFAVDEGVLQLTGFQMPSPLTALLENRALDVKTLQAFDLLMPDQELFAPRLSAFGGGAGAIFGKRFQNPFRRKNEPPVTIWSEVLNVGPEPVEVKIPVPDYYNGTLRIMAVGAAEQGAGSASINVTSVAPLVLTPTLPLTVSPGDEFDGNLVLANTSDRNMEVELTVEPCKSLDMLKALPDHARLEAGQDLALPFRMRANASPGPAILEFIATVGKEQYRRSSGLSIRPASPLRTSLMGGVADASMTILANRKVYPQNAASVATLSTLPLTLASGFAQYLQTYPYGCSEQLVSLSFAQALLRAWPQISADDKARQKLLEATLGALRSRFNGNGVSLWPNSEPDPLLTVYAADFLLALREAGIGAGEDLLNSLCDVIEKESALNESSLGAARIRAYGIWTLTRAGHITTQLLENLLDSLRDRRVPGWERDITAALIAASQKEMRMRKTQPFEGIEYGQDGFFDEFAQYALHTTILARYFPEKCTDEARKKFYEAAGMSMLENAFATFSASQGIRALLALSADTSPQMLEARVYCTDDEPEGKSELLANGALLNYRIAQCEKYRLELPRSSPKLFWQIATSGYDMLPAGREVTHGIEIRREFLDESGQPVKSVRQGDLVNVRITARATVAQIADCVISDLLPGGFEMVPGKNDGRQDASGQGLKYVDRQEDRMLLFADLTSRPFTYTYPVRAVNGGRYTVPPIAAEAMYNQSQYGHGASGEIEIIH